MEQKSVWKDTASKPYFEALSGNVKTDVLIIGGGISGILTAYLLRRHGVDCILCEAGEISAGVTENTTAKVTVQHGLIYDKLLCRMGKHKAQGYLLAQKEALSEYENLSKSYFFDFEKRDSYVYSTEHRKRLEEEVDAINGIGGKAEFVRDVPLPLETVGAVCIRDQAQMHPLKLVYALARHLPIFENTRILELTPRYARYAHGKIYAKKTVVATHFPFLNKHGLYVMKLYQHRSYVLGLENTTGVQGMYVDEAPTGLSFREYDGLLFLGGGAHRTGKNGGGWRELERFAAQKYPHSRPSYRWATQDCMTLDGLPYIGQYSKSTPNLYVATGYNKWGMTNAMVAARLLCDLILGKMNPYTEVFDPSRSMLCAQLARNTLSSVMGLITPTVPRCPHLGCALQYNKQEHTWDCPCHGSRFTADGRLLDNPATKGCKGNTRR